MNADELKAERAKRQYTQEQMAHFLGKTPISTYRKWEQGVNDIPAWVETILLPKSMAVPGLTLAEIVELSRQAEKAGMTIDDLIGKFIKDGLKGLMALALLLTLGHQIIHPEDQQARRFGGRRRQEDAGVVFEIDADAVG